MDDHGDHNPFWLVPDSSQNDGGIGIVIAWLGAALACALALCQAITIILDWITAAYSAMITWAADQLAALCALLF